MTDLRPFGVKDEGSRVRDAEGVARARFQCDLLWVHGWQFWDFGLKEGQGEAKGMRREGACLRIDASQCLYSPSYC